MYDTKKILRELFKVTFPLGQWEIEPKFSGLSIFTSSEDPQLIAKVERYAQKSSTASLISTSAMMVETLLQSYLFLQTEARKSMKFSIDSDGMRAMLRNQLAFSLGFTARYIHETVEQIVSTESYLISA